MTTENRVPRPSPIANGKNCWVDTETRWACTFFNLRLRNFYCEIPNGLVISSVSIIISLSIWHSVGLFFCFQKWFRFYLFFFPGISYSVKGQDKLLFSAILVFTQCLDTSCVAQTRKVLDKNICATFVVFSWRMPCKLVVAISTAKNA